MKFTIKGKKIRIYCDIDCDCGKRRTKWDKSIYVVGYRMHTLSAINAETGQRFPLISLLAPANHHDSHFLFTLAQRLVARATFTTIATLLLEMTGTRRKKKTKQMDFLEAAGF